jgi:small subunit ribosomal protein S5
MSKINQNRKSQKQGQTSEFEEALIDLARVTKVTAGGRQLRFRAAVAVGNKNGKVGFGMGKSGEVTGAIQKAVNQAKKHMMDVPLNQFKSTIPHEVKVKFKSAKILIMPAGPGTGIIAGSSMRQILVLAGVKDVLAKRFGSTNKINNAKATIKALSLLKVDPRNFKKSEPKEIKPQIKNEINVNKEQIKSKKEI